MGRRLVLSLAVTAAMALLVRTLIGALVATIAGFEVIASPDRLAALGIQGLVVASGLAYAVWLALTAAASTITLALAAVGHASSSLEGLIRRSGAPVARRLASVSVASTMLLTPAYGLAPAIAAPNEPGPDIVLIDLGWNAHHEDAPAALTPAPTETPAPPPAPTPTPTTSTPTTSTPPVPTPSRTPASTSSAAPTAPAPAPAPAAEAAPAPAAEATNDSSQSHTVVAGESLWSIAAARAGADASVADIADLWPRWYAANRSTIGANPDLIHPGMVLHAPNQETP